MEARLQIEQWRRDSRYNSGGETPVSPFLDKTDGGENLGRTVEAKLQDFWTRLMEGKRTCRTCSDETDGGKTPGRKCSDKTNGSKPS